MPKGEKNDLADAGVLLQGILPDIDLRNWLGYPFFFGRSDAFQHASVMSKFLDNIIDSIDTTEFSMLGLDDSFVPEPTEKNPSVAFEDAEQDFDLVFSAIKTGQ
ncbi:hypothetical protein OBBRIDRAFT_839418 [Obba rivulosa]|uniref:Uncharacterized protein n=1 Tax=Obba rivulosa TaxID=1052685 RepID=A0A8E2AM81_9APHY|nr:hypothetical protein OBBRIDRAFT_839418 [Obba rivulosa]